jgi:hypothetical protein
MDEFEIKFFKTVCNDIGHEVEITQRAIKVRANGKADAIRRAKAMFSRLEGVRDWTMHADRVVLTEATAAAGALGK